MSNIFSVSSAFNAIASEITRLENLYADEGRKNRVLSAHLAIARKTNQRLSTALEEAMKERDKAQESFKHASHLLSKGNHVDSPQAPKAEPEILYSVGDMFASPSDTSATHLFAQTGAAEVNLIDLDGGNRITKPMKVISAYKVPKAEFDAHFSGFSGPWGASRMWRKVRKVS